MERTARNLWNSQKYTNGAQSSVYQWDPGLRVLKLFMSLAQWVNVPQKTNKLLETVLEGIGNNTQHVIVLLSKLSSCLLLSVSQERCVRSSRVKVTGPLTQYAQGQADHINNLSGGCRNLCTSLCKVEALPKSSPLLLCRTSLMLPALLSFFFQRSQIQLGNLLFSNCW